MKNLRLSEEDLRAILSRQSGNTRTHVLEGADPGRKHRKPKYGNVRTEVDGMFFPSKKQAKRYGELTLMQNAGEIFNLTCERPFPLEVNGQRVCIYRADFTYSVVKTGAYVVEDVKGVRTALYKLKAALMKACMGITILET